MTARGHLHIIVPTHNRAEVLKNCLKCLAEQDDDAYSVMVVNDGSTDGTTELLETEFPDFEIVQGDGNLWWTGAVHKAIDTLLTRYANQPERIDNDAIVHINDDLEFNPNFLSTLRSISDLNKDMLVGSVVVNISDRSTITHGGWNINWLTAKTSYQNRGAKLSDFPHEHVVDVSTLTGRGVLIPLAVLRDVGSYNPLHFPQHGDFELPVRAARAGYVLKTYYKSIVYCHFDLEGDINNSKTYGVLDLKQLLFDQRSYLNLKERFWFAYDTRKNPLQFVVYLACDLARVAKSVVQKLSEHYMRGR